MRELKPEWLGRISYDSALALQEQRHQQVVTQQHVDTLFLLEHPPVVTLGKNSFTNNLRVSADELQQRGVNLVSTGRGGDITFHGPGQLVGYPIIALAESERDIKKYVWCLEEIMIRTAADWDIHATRIDGLRGIWVGDRKIGAVGVRIAEWVTMHGFALNICTDLNYFDLIVPCGIADKGVTSFHEELDSAPTTNEVARRVVHHAANVLQRKIDAPLRDGLKLTRDTHPQPQRATL